MYPNVVYKFPTSAERTARLLEANDKRHLRPSPDMSDMEYIRRRDLGFYRNFSDVDDLDGSSLVARKMACRVSRSVVAISCKNPSGLQQNSSGIVVEYNGTKKILTSAYIVGGRSEGLKVEILFPSGKKIEGLVSLIDDEHNIAFIHGDLDNIMGISFSLELASLDVNVMSLGRNSTFGLMASRGNINIRKDLLESDDLMSSSCTISESGIGGPLVDISTGLVIGINLYVQKKSTLFMPSIILNHCFQQMLDYGGMRRPCLGLRTRSIGEKNLNEMKLIYEKFPSTDGIVVNKVIKGSAADNVGILVDDIIIRLNNIPVSSPVQLADLLLKLGKASHKRKRTSTQGLIKVTIQRPATCAMFHKTIRFKYSTSPYVNRWPLLPLDIPVFEPVYDFLSFQREKTLRNALSTHDLAEKLPNDDQNLGNSNLTESLTNTSGVKEEHSHSDRNCTQEASFMTELQSARKIVVGSAGMDLRDGGLFPIKSGQNGDEFGGHEGSFPASNGTGENVKFSSLPYVADAKFSGFNVGFGLKSPDPDTLINLVDPIIAKNSSWAANSGTCNVDRWSLPSSTSVNVMGKSAAIDGAIKDERSMVAWHDPLPLHDHCKMRKPEISYDNQQ